MQKRIKQDEAQKLAVDLLGPKVLAVKLGQNKYAIRTKGHKWLRLFGKSEGKTIATGTSYAEALRKLAEEQGTTLDQLRGTTQELELIDEVNTTTSSTNRQ
jgi:hypothetical protein